MKVNRYRLSPNEIEQVLKEEKDRRKKERLIQVRQQAKANAAKIRDAVKAEKAKQLEILREKTRIELELERAEQLKVLEAEYERCLKSIGQAHKEADSEEKEHKDVKKQINKEEEDRKAEERHQLALKKQKLQNDMRKYQENKTIIARKRALDVEKERAAQIASLPPPIPDPVDQVEPPKHKPVTVIDAFSSTYFHLSEEDYGVVRAQPEEQIDARQLAAEEEERNNDENHDISRNRRDYVEKANLRGKHALHKEVLSRDYDKLLLDLSDLQRKDRDRRQKIVHNIPKNVFQPPHRHMEEKLEKQHLMEISFEDMYTEETDRVCPNIHLRGASFHEEDEVDESVKPALQDITNQLREAERRESVGLKKLLDKVKKQRDQWIQQSSQDLPEPEDNLPTIGGSDEIVPVEKSSDDVSSAESREVTDTERSSQPIDKSVSPSTLAATTVSAASSQMRDADTSDVLRHPLEEAIKIREAAQRQIQAVDEKLKHYREEHDIDQSQQSFLTLQQRLEKQAMDIQQKIEQLEAKRIAMEEKESKISHHLNELSQHSLDSSIDDDAKIPVTETSSVSSYMPPAVDERLLRIRQYQNELLVKHQLNQSGGTSSHLSSSILSGGTLTPPSVHSSTSYISPNAGISPTLSRQGTEPSSVIQAMTQMASLANRLYNLSPRGRELQLDVPADDLIGDETIKDTSVKYPYLDQHSEEGYLQLPPSEVRSTLPYRSHPRSLIQPVTADIRPKSPGSMSNRIQVESGKSLSPVTTSKDKINLAQPTDTSRIIPSPVSSMQPSNEKDVIPHEVIPSVTDESIQKRKESLEKQLAEIQTQKQDILTRHSEVYDNWSAKLQEWMKPLQSTSSGVEASTASDRLSTSGELTLEIDEKLLEEIDKLYDSSPESSDNGSKRRYPPPLTKKVMFRDDVTPHELSTIQEVETPKSDVSSSLRSNQSLASDDARRALAFMRSFEKIDQSLTTQSGSGNESVMPQSEHSPMQKSPSLTSDVTMSPTKSVELTQHSYVPSPQGIRHEGGSPVVAEGKTENQSSSSGTELSQYSVNSNDRSIIKLAPPELHYSDNEDETESAVPEEKSFKSPFAGIDDSTDVQPQQPEFAPLPLDVSTASAVHQTEDFSQHPLLTPALDGSAHSIKGADVPSPSIDLSAISSVSPAHHHETTTFYGASSLAESNTFKPSGSIYPDRSTMIPYHLNLDASLQSLGRTADMSQHPISTPSSITTSATPGSINSKMDESPFTGNISSGSGPRFQELQPSFSSFLESDANKRLSASAAEEKKAQIFKEKLPDVVRSGEMTISSFGDTSSLTQHSVEPSVRDDTTRYSLQNNLKWADILKGEQSTSAGETSRRFQELRPDKTPSPAFKIERGIRDLSITSSSSPLSSTSTPTSTDTSRLTAEASLQKLSPSIISTLLENTNWKSELSQYKVTPSSRTSSSLGMTTPDSSSLSMTQLESTKDMTQHLISPSESSENGRSLKKEDLRESPGMSSASSGSKADLTQYTIMPSETGADTTVKSSDDETKLTQHALEKSTSLNSLKSSTDEAKMTQYPLDTTQASSIKSEKMSQHPVLETSAVSSIKSEKITQYPIESAGEEISGRPASAAETSNSSPDEMTQLAIDTTLASSTQSGRVSEFPLTEDVTSDEKVEETTSEQVEFTVPGLDNSGLSTVYSAVSGNLGSTFEPLQSGTDSSAQKVTSEISSGTSLWFSSSNNKEGFDDVDGPTDKMARQQTEGIDDVDGLSYAGISDADTYLSLHPVDETMSDTESSSKWLVTENDDGILEEPDMTFSSLLSSSTIHDSVTQLADSTLTNPAEYDLSPSLMSFEQHELSVQTEASRRESGIAAPAEWETSDPSSDVKLSMKTSADRSKAEKEMLERNKRLYGRLDEVKQKRAEHERQKQYAENRQKAKEFQKKVRESLQKKKKKD